MTMVGRPVRPLYNALAAAFFSLAIFLLTVSLAHAHAVLLTSSPAQGARLELPPGTITLRFSEAVAQVGLELMFERNAPRPLKARISGAVVSADLDGQLQNGVYAINWKALSEDGHPVSAAIVFSIGTDRKLDLTLSDAAKMPPLWVTWSVKSLFYLCTLFGIGGVFFTRWIARSRPRGMVLILLLSAELSGCALVLLLGLELNTNPASQLFDLDTWRLAAETSLATSVLLVSLALIFAAVASFELKTARMAAFASFVLIGPAFALTGHASGAAVPAISFVAVSLHVAAICFWAGSLPNLLSVLGRRSGIYAGSVLVRFSAAIPFSIAGLIASGTYLAVVQIGAVSNLLETAYGKIFLVKITLVALTLLLGAYNRLLTPAVKQEAPAAIRRMKAIIVVEIVLVALILSVTALWRFTPPPRALILRPPMSASVHMHGEIAMATVSIEEEPSKSFHVEVAVATSEFDVLDPKELSLKLSSKSASIASFEVNLARKAAGLWTAEGILLPNVGEWDIRLEILVTDFDLATLEGKLAVEPDASDQ